MIFDYYVMSDRFYFGKSHRAVKNQFSAKSPGYSNVQRVSIKRYEPSVPAKLYMSKEFSSSADL